jgi:hypothetical protein
VVLCPSIESRVVHECLVKLDCMLVLLLGDLNLGVVSVYSEMPACRLS